MQVIDLCFTHFKSSIDSYSLPERFTFPFYYQPHPLCLLASKELQDNLEQLKLWLHDFSQSGKMLGILLVENKQGEIGYLSGFSGKLADNNNIHFVPPVDDSTNAEFYIKEHKVINQLNTELVALESAPELAEKQRLLAEVTLAANNEISDLQSKNSHQRQARKEQRSSAMLSLSGDEFSLLKDTLAKESVADKNALKYLKYAWQQKTVIAQQAEMIC